jgi:hypothetical protein
MLMACGARTGLREERVTTQLPDWRVSTVCQCGNCLTVPWCANSSGQFICELGTMGCSCTAFGQTPISRPLEALNPNGSATTLYCAGPANTALDNRPALVAFGGAVAHPPQSACLLSDQAYNRVVRQNLPNGFDRATLCPGRYACASIGTNTALGNYAFAEELLCPKADATSNPAVFVPGVDSAEAVNNARPLLGALCSLWAPPRFVGSNVGGTGTLPFFTCFARRGSAEQAIANAGMARRVNGVVVTDPGQTLAGDECVAYSNYNYLRITRTSDNSTVTVPLSGTGSAGTSAAGMAVTDFQLTQVGTATYQGATLSGARVHLEDLWSGALSGTPGVYTVSADDARVQGQYTLGGSTYSLRLTAIEPATTRWNGTWYTLDARFSSDDIGVVYDLHVELDLQRARPVASVNPVSDVECTSPQGAAVTVTGGWSGTSSEAWSAWTLHHDGAVITAAGGTSALLQVPLLTPSSPLLEAQLTVFDGAMTSSASAPVRVIDTTAPSLLSSWVHVDCDWGGSNDNQAEPKYCLGMNGTTSDLCSSSSVYTVQVSQYLGCDRGALIRQDNKACVRADPNHWGSNISNIVYEIYYAARDSWGNLGPTQRRSFKVVPEPSTAACYEPRSVVYNPCGWD